MKPRLPPGKAARPWLLRHLDVARRAGDLLDQKRAALLRDEEALRRAATANRAELAEALAVAQSWWDRAALVGGRRGARLATATTGTPAAAQVTWTMSLGVARPRAALTAGEEPAPALVGAGGAALREAAAAYRRVLRLALQTAQAEEEHRRVDAELARTTRRLRAIEWRWIPQHEQALAALDLSLDEAERADAARVRWASRR